jgi:hypothetical protein
MKADELGRITPPKPSPIKRPIKREGFSDPVKTKRAEKAVAPSVALTAQQGLWLELMQFYIREAWLLDERRLKEWLDLFTDDVPI